MEDSCFSKFRVHEEQKPGSIFFHSLVLVDLHYYNLDNLKRNQVFLCIDSTIKSGHIPCMLYCGQDEPWKGEIEFRGVSNHYPSIACYLYKLNSKKISFVFTVDEIDRKVSIDIYLNAAAFSNDIDPADELGVNRKPYSGSKENLKCLVQCFHTLKDDCVQYKNVYEYELRTIEDLHIYVQDFCKVNRRNIDPYVLSKFQPDLLLPSLRDYQAEAVHWMVNRECFEHYSKYYTLSYRTKLT